MYWSYVDSYQIIQNREKDYLVSPETSQLEQMLYLVRRHCLWVSPDTQVNEILCNQYGIWKSLKMISKTRQI